jgi:hypothetical protein
MEARIKTRKETAMIYKIINGFVFGLAMVLMVDFLIFIGLKLHYFDALEIKEFFNIYFYDNQPFLLVGVCALLLGGAMLYTPLYRWIQGFYLILLLASLSALYQPIGYSLGEKFFTKKDAKFAVGSQQFKADLLYEGRYYYYIKRDGIDRTIRISKEDGRHLQEEF